MRDPNGQGRGTTSDRIAGAIVILMALGIAFESRTFTVGFVTDPLGPKAFPLVSALLLLVGGTAIQFTPGGEHAWLPTRRMLRVFVATAALFGYASLIGLLGFFVTTLLAIGVFALLLGGRPLQSLVSATCTSGLLYGLFSYLLDIALPLGSLFIRGS